MAAAVSSFPVRSGSYVCQAFAQHHAERTTILQRFTWRHRPSGREGRTDDQPRSSRVTERIALTGSALPVMFGFDGSDDPQSDLVVGHAGVFPARGGVLRRVERRCGRASREAGRAPRGECCLAHCLTARFPDYFARWTGRFPGLLDRFDSVLAGCRPAVGASSRYAAPPLRSGPSGDPPPSARLSACMAVSGAFGHGPIARRIVVAGA